MMPRFPQRVSLFRRCRGSKRPAAVGVSEHANAFQLLGNGGTGAVEFQKEVRTFGKAEMALTVARHPGTRVETLHACYGAPGLDGLDHCFSRTLPHTEAP